jgi:hypothetical protein
MSPTPGIPMATLQIQAIVVALEKLVEDNPQLFRTVWLMITGATKSKNPWQYALRTLMAEAAKHAGEELADEILAARKSMKT